MPFFINELELRGRGLLSTEEFDDSPWLVYKVLDFPTFPELRQSSLEALAYVHKRQYIDGPVAGCSRQFENFLHGWGLDNKSRGIARF